MEPCIPDFVVHGWQLQRLFPGAETVVAAQERFEGLTVDSRKPVAGGIFVALQGRRVDAHAMVPAVFASGVRLAIVAQTAWRHFPADWQHYRCLPVASPLKALGELARWHRRGFAGPVVAVAGSAGKTTTKELLGAILARHFRVLKTPGNENNQLGVPLALLQLRPEHELAVLEIGTNSFGEVARLCQIAEPTHGVVTTIGEEHLEFFGTVAGVAQEETALVRFVRSRGGVAVVPLGEPFLEPQPGEVTFGLTPEATVWAEAEFLEDGHPLVRLHYGEEVGVCRLGIVGKAGVRAAVAAAAVAWALGVPLREVVAALSQYVPAASAEGYGRLRLERLPNGVMVLNDTYNANPLSMRAALEALSLLPCAGRRWAILGDMLELGVAAEELHRAVVELACRVADVVCVYGEHFSAAAAAYPEVIVCASHREIAERLLQEAHAGDVVLLKGSRGMAMEKVLELYHQGLMQGSYAVPSGDVDLEDL
jgi:UDP-N-acetylmuramoyl-tripeptide--D-alanyl-D-alanine ligase